MPSSIFSVDIHLEEMAQKLSLGQYPVKICTFEVLICSLLVQK